jgi:hypothetical protein
MSKSERDRKRRSKRWTLGQARQIVEQWQASGKSAVAFAAEQGFSATRLSYWTKQIEAVAPKAPRFVAVPISARIPTTSRGALGVEIDVDGLTLRGGDDEAQRLQTGECDVRRFGHEQRRRALRRRARWLQRARTPQVG